MRAVRSGTGRSPDVRTAAAAALAAAVVVLFILESLTSARIDSPVADEALTIASGLAFLRTGEVRLQAEEPVLGKALLAAPVLLLDPDLDFATDAWRHGDEWVAAFELLWENRVPPARLMLAARAPAIAATAALLLLILAAGWRLYGPGPGLVALLAAATCPDFLGHGHLALLDLPVTLAATAALALLLSYAHRPGRVRHVAFALALGAALATRASWLSLVAALAAAALARALLDPGLSARARRRPPGPLALRPRLGALYLLGGGLVVALGQALLVVLGCYLGDGRALLAGLERHALLESIGRPTYLLGQVSSDGFAHFFLVALGVKLPILVLALLGASLLSWPFLRLGMSRLELPALAYAATWIVVESCRPVQGGVRAVFPVYPVLFVLAARIFAAPLRPRAARLALATITSGALLGVAAASRPTYISYFNELVGGPERALGILADSSLDWGQDLGRLSAWLRARGNPPVRLALYTAAPPDAYGIRWQALPAAGPVLPPPPRLLPAEAPELLCISGNNLVGLYLERDLYGWLQRRRALARVGGSIWVYDLGGEPEAHRQLARLYEVAGWHRWAEHELGLAGDVGRGGETARGR